VNAWQRDQRADQKKSETKKRSVAGNVLRYMYAPRIGKNVSEIGRTLGVFPRLLANIFAMQGMFPRNHPALRDESLRLPVSEVFGTAFRSLDWTRAGVPRVLFFVAVVASVIFSVLAFLFVAAGFFAAPAHAGIFDSPNPTTDLSNKWLAYLFQTDPGNRDFVVNVPGGVDGSTTTQTIGNSIPVAFKTLAALYSNAMLVLAVIILVYHLITMVVNTAHEGTAMGRGAHQVWAPVRLVFALGLLVPIGNGFSSGQYLVLQLAKWGSGLASNVWANPNVGGRVTGQTTVMTARPDLEASQIIRTLMNIGYCGKAASLQFVPDPKAMNALPANTFANVEYALYYKNSQTAQRTAVESRRQPVIDGKGVSQSATSNGWSKTYYPVSPVNPASIASTSYIVAWNTNPCGTVVFPALETDGAMDANFKHILQGVADAHAVAFAAIEEDALQAGASRKASEVYQGTGKITIPFAVAGTFNLDKSVKNLEALYKLNFVGHLPAGVTYDNNTGLISYVGSGGSGARVMSSAMATSINQLGWMAAGGWFGALASKHNVFGKSAGLVPVTHANCDTEDCGEEALKVQLEQERKSTFASAKDWVTEGIGGLWNTFTSIVMGAFEWTGLVNPNGQFVWHTQFTSAMPMSDMVGLGSRLVDGAVTLLIVGMVCNLVSAAGYAVGEVDNLVANIGSGKNGASGGLGKMMGSVAKLLPAGKIAMIFEVIGKVAGVLAPVFFALAGILMLPGVLLFYVLPFLPFINFVTGIVTWLISLLQAVVAIPVIAIAHISPQGEGLPSQAARGAYTMMLQIFLRPVMMIFGLLATILIINTGIGFLNAVFFGVYRSNMLGNADGLLSGIVFMVMYAGACYGIVNAAVAAIDDFPLNAVTWIGGSRGVDNNHDIRGLGALAIVGATQQGIGQLTNNAQRMSGALQSNLQGTVQRNQQYGEQMGGYNKARENLFNREIHPSHPNQVDNRLANSLKPEPQPSAMGSEQMARLSQSDPRNNNPSSGSSGSGDPGGPGANPQGPFPTSTAGSDSAVGNAAANLIRNAGGNTGSNAANMVIGAGIVGGVSAAFSNDADASVTPPSQAAGGMAGGDHMAVAQSMMGLSENNPVEARRLSDFFSQTAGFKLNPDATKWCAAFVNGCLGSAGIAGSGSLAASSFMKWGVDASSEWHRGDVVVVNTGDGGHHVGFLAGMEQKNGHTYVKLLGGNQGDKVKISSFLADSVAAVRRDPNAVMGDAMGSVAYNSNASYTPAGAGETNTAAADAMKELMSRPDGERILHAMEAASQRTGISMDYLLVQTQQESHFRTDIPASGGASTAVGLNQFVENTWLGMIKQHGAEYGVGNLASHITIGRSGAQVDDPAVRQQILDLRKNPELSLAMSAEYTLDNKKQLEARGINVESGGDLYLAHFLGAAGAGQFLSADTAALAANLFPEAAAKNHNLFYGKDGNPLTVGQIRGNFDAKMSRGSAFSTARPSGITPATNVAQQEPEEQRIRGGYDDVIEMMAMNHMLKKNESSIIVTPTNQRVTQEEKLAWYAELIDLRAMRLILTAGTRNS